MVATSNIACIRVLTQVCSSVMVGPVLAAHHRQAQQQGGPRLCCAVLTKRLALVFLAAGQEELLPRPGRRAVLPGSEDPDRGKHTARLACIGMLRARVVPVLGSLQLLPKYYEQRRIPGVSRPTLEARASSPHACSPANAHLPVAAGWRVNNCVRGRPPVRSQRLVPGRPLRFLLLVNGPGFAASNGLAPCL